MNRSGLGTRLESERAINALLDRHQSLPLHGTMMQFWQTSLTQNQGSVGSSPTRATINWRVWIRGVIRWLAGPVSKITIPRSIVREAQDTPN